MPGIASKTARKSFQALRGGREGLEVRMIAGEFWDGFSLCRISFRARKERLSMRSSKESVIDDGWLCDICPSILAFVKLII